MVRVKVLQVVGLMNLAGAEVMLMELLRNKTSNVDFDFLINKLPSKMDECGTFDSEIIEHGCNIYSIESQGRIGYIEYYKKFKEIIEKSNPDVVHIHLNAKGGFIALCARLLKIKKIIVHCHADIKFRGRFISRIFSETEFKLQKILIKRYATDFWGCSNEANVRLFGQKLSKQALVVNNAINVDSFKCAELNAESIIRDKYNIDKNTIILGNVGRIVRHKNIKFIVDILHILESKDIDASMVVVGREDDKEYVDEIKKYALQLSLQSKIIFYGESNDIAGLMSEFDYFVGPALREGFGLVAVEAQAAGIPTLLYKGFPKLVDMNVGLVTFFDKFDSKLWADSIINNKKIVMDRNVIYDSIKEKGFDSKYNSVNICKYYERGL